MSEKAPRIPELTPVNHETLGTKSHEIHSKHHESVAEKSPDNKNETLASIRSEVSHIAASKEKTKLDSAISSPSTPQPLVNKELKDVMFNRTLTRIQKQLNPAQRGLSKVVHNKTVDKVSSVGEKTIARPIGILGGAILAFLGSILSTYMAKQFGLHYNLIIFAMLFVIGYFAASILEIFYKSVRRAKR